MTRLLPIQNPTVHLNSPTLGEHFIHQYGRDGKPGTEFRDDLLAEGLQQEFPEWVTIVPDENHKVNPD